MQSIKGIIFDMDGLLFDTEKVYSEVNIRLAKEFGLTGYDDAYYLTEVGLSDEEVFQKYLHDFSEHRAEVIKSFFEETRQATMHEFRTNGAPVKPYVVPLLEYLQEVRIPAVIASSNMKHYIEVLLEKSNIQNYFKGIVSADDVKNAKPDPEIVHKAVELLETPNVETLMLEDSINGIRAAHAAKVPVVMVPDMLPPDEEAREKTLCIVDSLADVLHFIKQR
ncbi:HAD family hydrolase [Vagococcus acidifermentans]|uniref:HAD family hydrolase n=1 Tax=Vagococcus acidifermentans TaxID=564710 RepID=A0A430AQI6_9ENTE|nr:HAD-IA family hydrolase [Vagococcus acidifermentans]RSU10243.1 hypothetical protein CBF27_10885 [Vagococcus acidifermentans]